MKQFLFITHITPRSKRSPLRQALNDAFFHSLRSQKYPHWKSIIIGEDEKTEDRFHFVKLPEASPGEGYAAIRAVLRREDVQAMIRESEYTVKLDDDDLISPDVLELASKLDFDCYFDRHHTFYDISSGQATQQQRPWIASTCIHRTSLLFKPYSESVVGNLLYTDHSKTWHEYYKEKRTIIAPPEHPVYLRVLSPTSITSGAFFGPPKTLADVDLKKYYAYLQSFGSWKKFDAADFSNYMPMLSAAWNDFAGSAQQPLPEFPGEPGLLKKILNRLKSASGKS